MKRIIICLFAFLTVSLMFNSCSKDEEYDQALLTGKWQLVGGTEIYRYNADGTGVFWDPADDVTEAGGQRFTWTLEKADLTHIHIMEIGGNVPKYYTVTELTSTKLKYKDDFATYSFTKVNK